MISTAADNDAPATDRLLAALADPTRRRIVELLAQAPRTASEIHGAFPIAPPAVSRHLRVLREAGLIAAQPVPGDNRVRLYTLEQDGLDGLAAWITELSQHWQRQLESFKDYVALRSARGPATQRDPAT
jgi:DNA-binding transcriptional ArsR family regulator